MKLYSFYKATFAMCLVATAFLSKAQNAQLFVGAGLATIQGETTDEFFFADELGIHVSTKYLYSFKNEQFVFFGEASHTNVNLFRQFKAREGFSEFFYNNLNQTYLGSGLRFYLTNSIDKINPYFGQVLPYVSVSLGLVNTSRDIIVDGNLPSTQGKKPISNPLDHYEITDGNTLEVTGQVEGGVAFVLNNSFSLEIFGSGRPGFSDTWDGIKGVTNRNDWHLGGGLGLTYRL